MSIISMQCIDKTLTITDAPIVDIGGLNTIQFSFCPMWDGYEKTVLFYLTPSQTYLESVLNDSVTIPSVLISEGSCFCFVVKGTKSGAEDRETQIFRCHIESGVVVAENPTESIREIFSKRLTDLENGSVVSGMTFNNTGTTYTYTGA